MGGVSKLKYIRVMGRHIGHLLSNSSGKKFFVLFLLLFIKSDIVSSKKE